MNLKDEIVAGESYALEFKRDAYSDEKVRLILRGIMPTLERYRFLRKVRPSADESVNESETIYEALPAMWHYQAAQLAVPIAGDCEPLRAYK